MANAKAEAQALTPVPGKSWGTLILVLLAGIAVPLNMFKAPGLAPTIIGYFGINGSDFGWLMSIYTVMGIILAFPAAGIIAKIGDKMTIVISLGFTVLGCLVGALAPNYTVLLVGRFLEGVSMGLIAVAAPAAISKWFPGHSRGLALGIWSPWVPLGNIIMLNACNPIASAFGGSWQSVWYVGGIYALILLILMVICYKEPDAPLLDPDEMVENLPEEVQEKNAKSKPAIANAGIWLIAIAFCLFNITQNATLNTFYPTYLGEVHGFTEGDAAFITSAITILAIPGCIFAGWLSDKIHSKRWVIIIGFIGVLIAAVWYFNFETTWQLWVAIIIGGFIGTFVTPCTFAASPEIMGPKANGLGMAIIGFMQNIGQFIGGIAIGYMYVGMGWATASYILFFPAIIIAIILTFATKKYLK